MVNVLKTITVLSRKLGVDAEVVLSETPPEVLVAWLSDRYFHSRDAEVTVMHRREEVLSPGVMRPGVPVFLDHFIDNLDEADWNLKDSNAIDQPLHHTAMKTKLTELQDACCYADVIVSSPVLDVVNRAFARVPALLVDETCLREPAHHHANFNEHSAKFKCLLEILQNFNSQCDTWQMLARKCGNEFVDLRASPDTSEDELLLWSGQIQLHENEKETISFERDAWSGKAKSLQALSKRCHGAIAHVRIRLVHENLRLKANLRDTEELA